MKKIAIKLSLFSCSLLLLSGCTFSNDALFPSLFGSDSQEAASKDGSILGSRDKGDLPQLGSTNFEPLEISDGGNTGTFVGQKVITFRTELAQLQNAIRNHNEELQRIRGSVINNALQYHKTIGTIEAKLQVGTTPGNPQMFTMLQNAQSNIQVMNSNTNSLSQLSSRVASDAAMTTYLLDSIKAAYTVSGAVDEDHRQLRILENETNQTSILINSLLSEINADASRQKQYIDTASNYIVNLSEAIKVGSYGVNNSPLNSSMVSPTFSRDAAISGKPLFVAKFNKSGVKYHDGLKRAVSSAVAKKPSVMFEVVAINPISSNHLTKSASNNYASEIFKEIVDMGVSADRISLTSRSSGDATASEVQIYIK